MSDWDVTFLDSGREPENAPNPKYPDGIDVDLRKHALQKYCCKSLPYPAPRCGLYRIECKTCKVSIALTVAGRPDDPRSATIPCGAGGLDG